MIDPYKVLGVRPDASAEEIKKAYHKKAKQYHPDLHPDDPAAAKKMNEVNEAYDLLQNPAEYRRRAAQEQMRNNYRNAGGEGWQRDGFGNYYRQGTYNDSGSNYRQSSYGQNESGYRQSGNFYGYGFGFEDLFRSQGYGSAPFAQAGDPVDLQQAIGAVNRGSYAEAFRTLDSMPGSLRNDRYYYVYGYAYKMTGAYQEAKDMVIQALRLKPDDPVYRSLLTEIAYRMQGTQERATSRSTRLTTGVSVIGKIIFGFIALRFFLRILGLLFGGFWF